MGKAERLRRERFLQWLTTPSSKAPKPGYELKIERAVEHLEALDSAVEKWLKEDAYTVFEKDDPHTGGKILCVKPLTRPPTAFAFLAGDCIHNLRSSLDHLAHALAWAGTRGPITERADRQRAFPVWVDPPKPGQIKQRIESVDPAAQAIIMGLQPLDADNGFVRNDLWLLDELWNFDKHRRLPTTLFHLEHFIIDPSFGAYAMEWFEGLNVRAIRGETPVARFKAMPENEMDMKRTPVCTVTLGEGTPTHGEPLVPLLRRLHDYVLRDVVEPLAPFLQEYPR